MPVAITIPCPTCAHLPVCALAPLLRDQLEPFRAPELITLPEALTVRASIEVDCRHFLAVAGDQVKAAPGDVTYVEGDMEERQWQLFRQDAAEPTISQLAPVAIPPGLSPVLEASRTAAASPEDVDPEIARALISPELRAAVELLERAVLGTDEPEKYSAPIPTPVAADPAEPVRRPDDYGMSEAERRAALRADPLAAVGRPTPRGRPATPPTEVCEPGCGQSFGAGIPYAEHRRTCETWRAYAFPHTRQLPDIPTAPLPDAAAGRNDFELRRTAAARQAGQRAWDARHPAPRPPRPVEVAPEPSPAPAPSSTREDPGLTARQQQILDALRANGGRINAAAKSMGLIGNGGLSSAVADLRHSKRLPADVEQLLSERRAERLGVKPAAD